MIRKINELIGIAMFFALIVAVIGFYPFILYRSEETVEVKVVKAEIKTRNSNSVYLVFAENETFRLTDSWLFWRFDSSDLYGNIQVGQTYRARVYGWRVPFLSWYRNVIAVEKVSG